MYHLNLGICWLFFSHSFEIFLVPGMTSYFWLKFQYLGYYIIQAFCFSRPPLTWLQWRNKRHHLLLPAADGSPGSPRSLHCYHGNGYLVTSWLPASPFLVTTQLTEAPPYSLGRVKSRFPTWPLLAWVGVGSHCFSGCV